MTGLTDLTARAELDYISGQLSQASLGASGATTNDKFLGLFTAAPTDAGGGTEVTTAGTAYARVQIAGQLPAASAATTVITFGAVPAWVVAGMSVRDVTTPANVPAATTVVSVTATTVTCSATVSGVGTDTIRFSAFTPSTGSAPAQTVNNSIVSFAAATGAGFGTVIAFGIFDAVTAGNLLLWDFMGNFGWLPFEMPNVTAVATVKAHGYASNDPLVFTTEYGGTFPTFSTGAMTSFTVSFAGTITTDSFIPNTTSGPSTPFVSTSSGSGMVRKIVQQSIPAGVTASFAAATLTFTLA